MAGARGFHAIQYSPTRNLVNDWSWYEQIVMNLDESWWIMLGPRILHALFVSHVTDKIWTPGGVDAIGCGVSDNSGVQYCPILSNDIPGPRGSLQTGRSYHTGCSWLQSAAVFEDYWSAIEAFELYDSKRLGRWGAGWAVRLQRRRSI